MIEPFGATYAEAYDTIYHDKDYTAECDLVERLFSQHTAGPVREILDLGCGTGQHAELLVDRGYEVVGVDRSPHMIAQANRRAAERRSPRSPVYHVGDLRTFRTDHRFDAVLMMFAVLGYQLEDNDVLSALSTARALLRNGGLLLFDCWYGPAVLHQQPTARAKTVECSDGRLVRTSTSQLDVPRCWITVRFHVERTAGLEERRAEETHCLRFFFGSDMETFLRATGFSLVRIGAMPDFDKDPDETTWNVLVLARADLPTDARNAGIPAPSGR